MYERKTKDVFIIETNYGYGWEVESTYDTREEAKRDFPDYVMMVKSYGGNARIRKTRERR